MHDYKNDDLSKSVEEIVKEVKVLADTYGADCAACSGAGSFFKQPTGEELVAQGKAFKESLAPPTTESRAQEITKEAVKAKKTMLEEFTVNDSEELVFLKKYIKSLKMRYWKPEDRLSFINSIIEWSDDDSLCNAAAIRKKVEDEITTKKQELQRLEEELKSISVDK